MQLPSIANSLLLAAGLASRAAACGTGSSCYGPANHVEHVRHVKRIQPGVPEAAYGPKAPLEWGQVNFLHTTDTHGWLAGHLKEQNYGADWGDFVTFTRRMKQMAFLRGVDMLLIDTGDLHDGAGLSDVTTPDGQVSMPIFDKIDYDLLTVGNHELYVSDVAYQMFQTYAKQWGDRYVTSNVKVYNQTTGQYEYLGATHRYFTTRKGLKVMAFGVLYDFAGNSNASQVIKASDMIQQSWFQDALATKDCIDLFILFGHNPVRTVGTGSTLKTVWDAIRKVHPTTPIQIFGGHTHIRDLQVYDESSIGIESGRYCETVGWVSMSGFNKDNSEYHGVKNPHGVPNPSHKATADSKSPFLFSRRYLDWNRKTFMYHTHQKSITYDYHSGLRVTHDITKERNQYNVGKVYGCAPQSWCLSCAPFNDTSKNVFPGVIVPAVKAVVVNETRKDKSRIILGSTGGIRFDVNKGPFTYDDNFVVSPFRDAFLYIPDVPFDKAKNVITKLNAGPASKRDNLAAMPVERDECTNPSLGFMSKREFDEPQPRSILRRQKTLTPGYVTKDDWGSDGDDTAHSPIPYYTLPNYWEARGGFPSDGSDPQTVDLIFFDFIENLILLALGSGYTKDMVSCYLACNFTSQDFMLPYAKLAWQDNINDCPV